MRSDIKPILKFFAVSLLLAGGIFFLQGINIIPGSFMTGDPKWAVTGAIMALVGTGIFWFADRK